MLISLTGKEAEFSKYVQKGSDDMNGIFYKGFTDDEIIQFEGMLERMLLNCKEAE